MKAVAPRLHVLMARKAPVGVVIRRGPSKQVAVLRWDRKTDVVEPGQWLKGRIYPMRSDLSPDGRYMIYFAMNGKWHDDLGGSWTAVSRVPYLTALHLYGWGHCWNGGGLFTSNRGYWLNRAGGAPNGEWLQDSHLTRGDAPPPGVVPAMGEDPLIYLPRLQRDGWQLVDERAEKGNHRAILEKPVRAKWTLEKTFHAGFATGPNSESYWESHRLLGPDGAIDGQDWEWADTDGRSVVAASGGALWRRRVHAKTAEDPKLIHDFTNMTFEAREAPYAGIRTGDRT
jgi:hypothetical protein